MVCNVNNFSLTILAEFYLSLHSIAGRSAFQRPFPSPITHTKSIRSYYLTLVVFKPHEGEKCVFTRGDSVFPFCSFPGQVGGGANLKAFSELRHRCEFGAELAEDMDKHTLFVFCGRVSAGFPPQMNSLILEE